MEEYQKCLVIERDELTKKLEALREFFMSKEFANLTWIESMLSNKQYVAMSAYAEILNARIQLFTQFVRVTGSDK